MDSIIQQMPAWVQWFSIALGAVLLWMGIFTTPAEQGRFSNVLSDWWVRVETVRERSLSVLGAVFVVVAEKFSRAADAMFGERILSVQAVASSLGLSAVSAAVSVLLFTAFEPSEIASGLTDVGIIISIATGSLGAVVASFNFIFPGRQRLHVIVAIVSTGSASLVSAVGYVLAYAATHPVNQLAFRLYVLFGILIFALGLSFISDVIFIAVTRKTLRTISGVTATSKAIGLLGVNIVLACALIVVPFSVFSMNSSAKSLSRISLSLISVSLVQFNLLVGIIIAVILIMTTIVLIYGLFWPSRILEVLEAERLLTYRKTLAVTGLALMSPGLLWLAKALGLVLTHNSGR